ncbi:hypothetical protein Avbf_10916 [Armadillidium vulgare]|nr:hypothetical protein Avbf_10916 [Armadillidium vulgare]
MAYNVSFLCKIFKSVVGAVLLCIGLTAILPVYIILFVVKRIIILLIYYRFGNSVSELFGMDMLFATSFEAKNPIINAFLKFDGNLRFEDLKNLIKNKIENSEFPGGSNSFKKFKQTLQSYYGYFVWKDTDNFDINNHIKRINLSELYPGEAQNINKTNSLLQNSCAEILTCKYLSEYGSQPFPDNLPQWEILILTQEGSSEDVMLLRLHHSIGDGISLLRLLLEELSDEPTTLSFSQPSMSKFEKTVQLVWSVTLIPFIYVTSKDIPFDIVKSIKKGTKASATDILFSCLSFSFGFFLSDEFEFYVSQNFPAFQLFILSFGFNYKRGVEVSEITTSFTFVGHDSTSPLTLSNTFTIGIATLPTPSIKKLEESYSGPLTDVYMVGKRIKEIRFWVPDNSPNGAGFTFISYKGQLRVSFNVDTALISKQKRLRN